MIPSLQPDMEDPELVRKKAIKARQKEFSERLQQVGTTHDSTYSVLLVLAFKWMQLV